MHLASTLQAHSPCIHDTAHTLWRTTTTTSHRRRHTTPRQTIVHHIVHGAKKGTQATAESIFLPETQAEHRTADKRHRHNTPHIADTHQKPPRRPPQERKENRGEKHHGQREAQETSHGGGVAVGVQGGTAYGFFVGRKEKDPLPR